MYTGFETHTKSLETLVTICLLLLPFSPNKEGEIAQLARSYELGMILDTILFIHTHVTFFFSTNVNIQWCYRCSQSQMTLIFAEVAGIAGSIEDCLCHTLSSYSNPAIQANMYGLSIFI